jgi:hypothetical protein
VILETFTKDPFAHRLASSNAKIAFSNEEKVTLNVSLRNKMREIFAKDKSAPTNARKKRYHAHFRIREFKSDIFGCYPKSNKKDTFFEV